MSDLDLADGDTVVVSAHQAARTRAAKAMRRRMVDHIAGGTTDRAAGPMVLPKEVYTDPTRFAAEQAQLFLGQPILAGLSGDIPDPGDVMVFDAAGPSILIMRGKDGVARAFLNMCTHRGARLVESQEPHSEHRGRVTCPFHAWTFDNGGRLIGQPSKAGFEGCDIGRRDLVAVPCAEWGGLIFVRPGGGEEIDIAAHLGGLYEVLEMIEMHRAVPVKKGILHADSNWKFALDTYGESYHFSTLHASTIGQSFYTDVAVYDHYGPHYRVAFPDKGFATAAGRPEAEWPEFEYGAVHYLFPNTVIFFGSIMPGVYFTQVFRLFPDGVGKTRCHFAVYAPFGILSDAYRDVCVMAYDATAQVVQTEDYRVASTGYANLVTAPAGYCSVLGANEIALQGMQRHIADAVGMPL